MAFVIEVDAVDANDRSSACDAMRARAAFGCATTTTTTTTTTMTTMDAQLLALAKAQDDFRQHVSVGLTDLKSIYDACAREHGNEVNFFVWHSNGSSYGRYVSN